MSKVLLKHRNSHHSIPQWDSIMCAAPTSTRSPTQQCGWIFEAVSKILPSFSGKQSLLPVSEVGIQETLPDPAALFCSKLLPLNLNLLVNQRPRHRGKAGRNSASQYPSLSCSGTISKHPQDMAEMARDKLKSRNVGHLAAVGACRGMGMTTDAG